MYKKQKPVLLGESGNDHKKLTIGLGLPSCTDTKTHTFGCVRLGFYCRRRQLFNYKTSLTTTGIQIELTCQHVAYYRQWQVGLQEARTGDALWHYKHLLDDAVAS